MLWGVIDSYLIRDSDILDYNVDIVSSNPWRNAFQESLWTEQKTDRHWVLKTVQITSSGT